MNLSSLIKPLDAILKRSQIPYVVIGGYAVAAWGEERATRDLGLLCAAGNSKRIVAELQKENLRFEHRIGDSDDPISEVIRVEMGPVMDPAEIGLLIGIQNVPAGIFDRARIVNIDDPAIPVASPEDMIVLKLLGGSARDLEDAKSIIEIQGERMDRNLLLKLCPMQIRNTLEELLRS